MNIAQVASLLCSSGLEPAAIERIEADFAAASDAGFQGNDGAAARQAIGAGQVAIRLGIARKALLTAAAPTYASEARVQEINRTLAQGSMLDAVGILARLVAAGHAGREWTVSAPVAPKVGSTSAPSSLPKVDALTNICRHHREHERFYVQDRTAVAANLHREANKLKVVAEAWLGKPAAQLDPEVDYTSPLYAPIGCTDLNELNAIAMVGVLFMEGEQEPIEIKVLKASLSALSVAWRRAGEWLAVKMEAAWDRERAMYQPMFIDVAPQRYNTIVTNWRGSRERLLAARTLEMALRVLESIPFEPQRIRADRRALGLRLQEAAAILSAAAQLVARTASDLADNDFDWTDCIRHLEPQTSISERARTP
jgi:hypothetical protein